MQIEGTPKIREVSKHYSFYRFFWSIHCRVILGPGDQATNNVMLRKAHYLVKAFTQVFQILSFTFVCSVNLSVCACVSISLFLAVFVLISLRCSPLYPTIKLLKAFNISC